MNTNRQRLDHRAFQRGNAVGQLEAATCRIGHIALKGAVIRRRRHKLHLFAEVVAAGHAVLAVTAAKARLHDDLIADSHIRDLASDLQDFTGALMAEDIGERHLAPANAAAAEIGHIRAAHTAVLHPDEHLIRLDLRHITGENRNLPNLKQSCFFVFHNE